MSQISTTNQKISLDQLQLIVYDFDGVLTDNRVLVFSDGLEAVYCNRSDGLAIEFIKKAGVPQLILSKEKNKVVKARAAKLKINVLSGVDDKATVLRKYCQDNCVSLDQVLYVGNDTNDIEVMKIVGFPVAPKDAIKDVLDVAKTVVPRNGGDGVIKELYDNVLTK